MIKQTWNVDLYEKIRILRLHENATKNQYLLREQGARMVDPGTTGKVENKTFAVSDLGKQFPMGEYDSPEIKQRILDLKPQIQEFIKNSDSSKFNLVISAGESQITNPEKFRKLGKGSLALERSNTVKRYFQEFYKDLIDNGTLTISGPTTLKDVEIGKTKFYPGSTKLTQTNKDEHKFYLDNKSNYDKEQFVKFVITGEGTKETKGKPPTYICDFKAEDSGGRADKENNFLYTATTLNISEVPVGTRFRISFNPADVPDMMICSTETETQSTGFVGENWGTVLATILGNAYGQDIPNPLPSNIVPLDKESAQSSFGKVSSDSMRKWFEHVMPNVNFNKKPSKIVDQINWYKFTTRVIDSRYDQNFDFPGRYGKTLYFTKKPEDKSLTIKVYSPIGTTVWKLVGGCDESETV